MQFNRVREVLLDSHTARRFPAAVVEVGDSERVLWREAVGRLTYEDDAPAARDDTVFDLASLTKPIATTTVALQLVEAQRLSLADRVSRRVRHWTGRRRAEVTVRDLLEHCAGLTAWLPFYRDHEGRAEFEAAIAQLALEYTPWTRSIYSDLGFILLGFILEDAGGAPLDRQFAALLPDLDLRFRPPANWRSRTAPTEADPWRGRALVGEVHDENAWALGGVAGHAGLFGTAPAVGVFARLVLRTLNGVTVLARPETLRRFLTRSTVPGSSRALGWDTMLPTSSCGTRLSPASFGHTGFTGTSLWIDPVRRIYVVLLTNRVHPTRDSEGFHAVRPAVHDAVIEALDAGLRDEK
jgi:CubicO group peptidase (beta-lactamase class C family)